jgi:AraC-like DNA-binding protein
MAALDNLLELIHLQVDVYHNAKICGDWSMSEGELGRTCFHLITLSRCELSVPGHIQCILEEGDLLIFPKELPHSIYSLKDHEGLQEEEHLSYSSGKEGTGMLCGKVQFTTEGKSHLLNTLPPVWIIRKKKGKHWIQPLLHMIQQESFKESPSETVINRLAELLFIHAIRYYLEQEHQEAEVLALYTHSSLSKALEGIHRNPERAWSLEALGRECGLSRTSFATLFKKVSGWTPNQYLVWWRMQVAWRLLRQGGVTAMVAEQVGYVSVASFTKAFQKAFQTTPSKVRKASKYA